MKLSLSKLIKFAKKAAPVIIANAPQIIAAGKKVKKALKGKPKPQAD